MVRMIAKVPGIAAYAYRHNIGRPFVLLRFRAPESRTLHCRLGGDGQSIGGQSFSPQSSSMKRCSSCCVLNGANELPSMPSSLTVPGSSSADSQSGGSSWSP